MYRALLAQADSKHVQHLEQKESEQIQFGASSTSAAIADVAPGQEDIARLRNELSRMSADHHAQTDALRQELTSVRTARAQAETAREFLQARVDSLSMLYDASSKELEKLRSALSESHGQLVQLQSLLGTRAQEVGL